MTGRPRPEPVEGPVRLQLSRRKGFNLQEVSQATNGLPAVNVARPSRWGNPFHVTTFYRPGQNTVTDAAREAVDRFRAYLGGMIDEPSVAAALAELRGRNLACWCPPGAPCHADVLLELANGPRREEA